MRRSIAGVAIVLLVASALPLGALAGSDRAGAVTTVASGRASVEEAIRGCANRNRRARGLEPLLPGEPLNKAARLHARNMARRGFFDHTDPQGRNVDDRVAIFDHAHRFTFIGENIAAGYSSATSACQGWINSPGHRGNILNPDYTHIGGGFATGGPYGRYYVQVFAATRSASSNHLK
jgi:uncharacterized protein YkwD